MSPVSAVRRPSAPRNRATARRTPGWRPSAAAVLTVDRGGAGAVGNSTPDVPVFACAARTLGRDVRGSRSLITAGGSAPPSADDRAPLAARCPAAPLPRYRSDCRHGRLPGPGRGIVTAAVSASAAVTVVRLLEAR